MRRLEEIKQKKIYEIVSIVKLSSLLFSAIALLRYFLGLNSSRISISSKYFTLISSIIIILIIAGIYSIWAFSTIRKSNYTCTKVTQIVEIGSFIFIFYIAILLTGGHTSSYKFLFLFIIITTTIQEGMKQGLITAIISSCIILTIDLIGGSSTNVNQYFENDLIIVGVFILTAWPLGFYVKIEKGHIEQLINQANVDGLTGLYNHRYFHENLREKMILSEKENQPISMIIMDID